jgi:hypothetical protein
MIDIRKLDCKFRNRPILNKSNRPICTMLNMIRIRHLLVASILISSTEEFAHQLWTMLYNEFGSAAKSRPYGASSA